MKTIEIYPQNVCSRKILLSFENDIIKEVKVEGGCNGNTQAISKLLVGYTLKEAYQRLDGIKCRGSRTGETSCPNELAKGIKELLK